MTKSVTSSLLFILIFLVQFSTVNGQPVSSDGYELVWQDEFNGNKLDKKQHWTVVSDGEGGGNKELQYYSNKNVKLGKEPISDENCLIITAKKESYKSKTATSGKIISKNKVAFKYGKLEARIKTPKTADGLWPAFWMLGSDYIENGWPKCGEIDIFEMGHKDGIANGVQDRYFNGACHWGESWNGGSYPNKGIPSTNPVGLQDDFHLFTLIWEENCIKMYLDLDKYPNSTPYFEMPITQSEDINSSANYFRKPYYIIFNLAVGGTFSEIYDINDITALNNGDATMYVDYIRLYQRAGNEHEFVSKINK